MYTPRDENRVTAVFGTSNADGVTPVAPYANPTTHEIMVETGATGSDLGSNNAPKDENFDSGLLCESSAGDGAMVPVYVDSTSKKLLISIL